MNKDAQESTSKSAGLLRGKSNVLATAAMFLIVILLWRDQSKLKTAQAELIQQNATLREDLATKQVALASVHTELDFFKTGDTRKAAQENISRTDPITPAPAAELETLQLNPPSVSQTAEGLVAHFEFKSLTDELPDQITLVVRVPGNTEAKILKLTPVGTPEDSSIACVVNAQGKLAMIEGSSEALKTLAFELTVSAPVKARVRGSNGILDFELDITPDGCTVQKL
jgi:hypothetical protein